MKISDKVKGLRLSQLVLSLGWEGAREYIAKLSEAEKKEYFTTINK